MLKFLYETQDVKLFDSPNDTGLPGGEGEWMRTPLLIFYCLRILENKEVDIAKLVSGIHFSVIEILFWYHRWSGKKKKKKLYLPLLMFCMHSLVSLVLPLFENRSQCHVLLRLVGWYVLCYSASYSLCSFQYCTTPHDRDIPKRSRLPSVEQEKSYVFNK